MNEIAFFVPGVPRPSGSKKSFVPIDKRTGQPFRAKATGRIVVNTVDDILAGSRPGDTILDPFGGSGTTGQVALELGRKAILCELNPDYAALAETRTSTTLGLAL